MIRWGGKCRDVKAKTVIWVVIIILQLIFFVIYIIEILIWCCIRQVSTLSGPSPSSSYYFPVNRGLDIHKLIMRQVRLGQSTVMHKVIMKLSKIQQSKSILPDGDHHGRDSWGIFLSPEQPDHAIKLFYNGKKFNDEKVAYDKVLGDPDLIRFANKYKEISVQLDTPIYPSDRTSPPFTRALLIPYLSDPPWKIIGKLGTEAADDKLSKIGLNVEELKDSFCRAGIAYWEVTFFVNSISCDIKAIDFTYSDLVSNNNANTEV